jgi:hypothetical protein
VKKAKLTPWFSGDIDPHRVGVYQRYLYGRKSVTYARWDGKKWKAASANIDVASRASYVSGFQRDMQIKWRGLAENPNA